MSAKVAKLAHCKVVTGSVGWPYVLYGSRELLEYIIYLLTERWILVPIGSVPTSPIRLCDDRECIKMLMAQRSSAKHTLGQLKMCFMHCLTTIHSRNRQTDDWSRIGKMDRKLQRSHHLTQMHNNKIICWQTNEQEVTSPLARSPFLLRRAVRRYSDATPSQNKMRVQAKVWPSLLGHMRLTCEPKAYAQMAAEAQLEVYYVSRCVVCNGELAFMCLPNSPVCPGHDCKLLTPSEYWC